MAYVSRTGRIFAYWKALPMRMWNQYPEQMAFYLTFGVAAVVAAVYKGRKFTMEGERPYYRGYYSVVRPDDPIAINWRKPEEYPAPYTSKAFETA